jgi:hypothetical protein
MGGTRSEAGAGTSGIRRRGHRRTDLQSGYQMSSQGCGDEGLYMVSAGITAAPDLLPERRCIAAIRSRWRYSASAHIPAFASNAAAAFLCEATAGSDRLRWRGSGDGGARSSSCARIENGG